MSARESLFSIAPLATGELLVLADAATYAMVVPHAGALAVRAVQADTGEAAAVLAAERAETLDCVIVDAGLPGLDALELVRRLRGEPATSMVPLVAILAATPNEQELIELLDLGVTDHLIKPLSESLVCAKLRAVCERARAQRELRSRLRFALENAAHDALTGLFNRRYFERRLREESAHARRHKRPFSILLVDIDHFKSVNDTFGHEDGDRVLCHVAALVTGGLREEDVACRYGGEEFVILLRATTRSAGLVVANRLRAAFASKAIALGKERDPRLITFSAGVAAADDTNQFHADDIVARADQALYRAKRAGRNRVELE